MNYEKAKSINSRYFIQHLLIICAIILGNGMFHIIGKIVLKLCVFKI